LEVLELAPAREKAAMRYLLKVFSRVGQIASMVPSVHHAFLKYQD